MTDKELKDRIGAALDGVPQQQKDISPDVLQGIVRRIESSLQPVAPLPSMPATGSVLVIGVGGIATLGAAILGMHGIQAMKSGTALAICIALLVLLCMAAISAVQRGIPGSRNWISASGLLIAAMFATIGLFVTSFSDSSRDNFVGEGIRCLMAGLFQAIPVAVLISFVLRRHFAVDLKPAMMVRGILAGLGGLIMLELHCPRLQVLHLAFWHTAVLPVCALAGVILALVHRLPRRSSRC